jgi:predicted DsbA family dithiol-disulfide isomerase
MQEHVTRVASGEGLAFALGEVKLGNTFDAHRLIQFAASRGLGPAMKERLLRGYFEEGVRPSDREALVALAEETGLPAEEARSVLASDTFANSVRQDEATARELGIRGVPFFLIDGAYGISGAQESATMLEVLEEVRRRSTTVATEQGPGCDDDACEL